MSVYVIRDGRGERRFDDGDFPLSIGGAEADIQVDESPGTGPLGYLGLSEGDVFVQPADEQYRLIVNGAALETSHWLDNGDVLRFGTTRLQVETNGEEIRFAVRAGATPDRQTDPPLIAPPTARDLGDQAPAAAIQPVSFEPNRAFEAAGRRRAFRPLGAIVILLLAALLVFAAFLFTSRSVLIEIEPAADRITIEGGPVLELGGRFLLRPGGYTLSAEKAGFSPLEEPLEVTPDTQQRFAFTLAKLPGRLEVTNAVDGAEVLVDGEVHGVTPLAALELPPGEHQIDVQHPRYTPFSTAVTIAGGGATQQLAAELTPRWAEISFASQPAGARVRVGGEVLGETPLTAEILDGAHDYDLFLGGYKPHRGRLEVIASEAQTIPPIRLTPSDGNLVLSSEPSGATVSVGGTYRGETPLDLFLDPRREHEVSVSKAGYATQKQTLQVTSGETREISFVLPAQEGEVQISAWPTDAELFIDGESKGAASQTLRLPAIPHQLEIRKAGFTTHSQALTPLPGVAQWVEVTLKPLSQVAAEARDRETPPVIRTAQGQELRLIEGGQFSMGASRREPGRRSNEVLREVKITRPFYLGVHEISNQQFRQFKEDHFSGQVGGHNLEIDHHAAVRMTWDEAAAFCNWLSAQDGLPPAYVDQGGFFVAAVPMTTGYRLPTEAEWAWAARYGQGEATLKYPWGNKLPVAPESGNYGDLSAQAVLPGALTDYNDGFPATAPIDSFAPNARGLHNLGGNVAEWMHDFYAIRMGGSQQVERDPRGPAEGEFRVIRGSSWMHSTVTELRLSFRDYGNEARPDVGFRIARYAK